MGANKKEPCNPKALFLCFTKCLICPTLDEDFYTAIPLHLSKTNRKFNKLFLPK